MMRNNYIVAWAILQGSILPRHWSPAS